MSSNVAKALRRHPQTTCTACKQDLFWDPAESRYSAPDDPEGVSMCAASETFFHLPANGKRYSPFAGDSGGVSRG